MHTFDYLHYRPTSLLNELDSSNSVWSTFSTTNNFQTSPNSAYGVIILNNDDQKYSGHTKATDGKKIHAPYQHLTYQNTNIILSSNPAYEPSALTPTITGEANIE